MADTPILGCVYIFAGNFAPRGYMLCQGQVLSISQYAALFSILGTTYGGNGTSTFALPDLRGRAAVSEGIGPGLSPVALGQQGGSQSVSIQASNMPPHNHLINVNSGNGDQAFAPGNFPAGEVDSTATQLTSFGSAATPGKTLAPTAVTMTGGGVPLAVQSPYLGINYIIAVEGIFPSRS